jgi:hypothetical protein
MRNWFLLSLDYFRVRDEPDATVIRHSQQMFGILDACTGWIKNE